MHTRGCGWDRGSFEWDVNVLEQGAGSDATEAVGSFYEVVAGLAGMFAAQ